jgi:hypothetical protein
VLKNGVPYEVAIQLDEDELIAYCVVFGQMEGQIWNWSLMQFEERK